MSKMAKIKVISMMIPLIMVAETHATAQDVHEIIDICTSSEKIMKDYALIGMKFTYGELQRDLKKTTAHIDAEITDLESHKVSKSLHDAEVALDKEWTNIEKELKNSPEKRSALALEHHIDIFAKHCETLAEHLADDVQNKGEQYVVEIARLNLDVQRLAGAYVMRSWKAIADDEYAKIVKEILEDYTKTYQKLIQADEKMVSNEVKEKLRTIKKHFMLFEFMAESNTGRYVPLLASKKANKINKETTEILKLEESKVE